MKNLKKVLALVLVVAMMASFAVTASAAFTDASSITYTTAVEVLSGLNVINGYGDGSFRPTDLVTRGAMAKMTAYVMNKGTNATASYGAAATLAFSDVATSNTYANAIGFVVQKGIVGGYADGTFRASNKVTGLAAAKMLLGALGYKSEVEGYTGEKWKQNVIADGEDAGLFAGLESVDLTANLTREQAAQMIWNALNATMVEYETTGSTITAGDITITSGAVRKDLTTTLAGKYFDTLTKSTTVTVDEFGAPCTVWMYKSKPIATVVDEPTLTYDTTVTAAAIAKALDVTVASQTGITVQANMAASHYIGSVELTAALSNVGPGVITKVYTNDEGNITHIVKIIPSLVDVTSVSTINATATTGAYTQYTIGGTNYKVYSSVVDPKTEVDTIVVNGAVKGKDSVLMYKTSKTTYVSAVESVTGAVTAVSSTGAVTIGGVSRVKAQAYTGVDVALSKTDATYLVDSYGNLLKKVSASGSTPDPIALVLGGDYVDTLNNNKVERTYFATVVTTDGSVIELPLGTKEETALSEAMEGTVVSYKLETTGFYTLTDCDKDVAVTEIKAGANGLTTNGTLYANNGTLYIFVNYTKDATGIDVVDGTVSTVTGCANVATYTGLTETFALDTDATEDHIADVVFVYDNTKATVAATEKLFYVTGAYTQTVDGFTYDVIVDGAASTVTMKSACLNKGVYTSITEGSDASTPATSAKGSTSIQNNGGLLFVDGSYKNTVASDAPVYVINADFAVTALTAADITASTTANTLGYTTIAIYYTTNPTTGAITSVVIVAA